MCVFSFLFLVSFRSRFLRGHAPAACLSGVPAVVSLALVRCALRRQFLSPPYPLLRRPRLVSGEPPLPLSFSPILLTPANIIDRTSFLTFLNVPLMLQR